MNLQKLRSNKTFILMDVVLVTFFLGMSLFMAGLDMKDGMPLQVHTTAFKQTAYKSFDLPNHDYFNTGIEGMLWWHPQNFGQALILGTVSNNGMDVFHVALLYVLVLIFYFMLKGTKKGIVFSKRVTTGFTRIVFLIGTSGTLEIFKTILVSFYFNHITAGKFNIQVPYFPMMFYYAIGMMLFFIVRFPQKAMELQDEQALTI